MDWDRLTQDLEAATPGGWQPGHLCDPDHSCECRYIFGGDDRMGAVASVHLDDGENDCPPKSEAIANQRVLAQAPDLARLALAGRALAEAVRTFNETLGSDPVAVDYARDDLDAALAAWDALTPPPAPSGP